MGAISLRLPDELEAQLALEAEVTDSPKSEVARRALAEWLAARRRQRQIDEMAAAAKALYSDPAYLEEMREFEDACVDDGMDEIIAQERAAGIDPDAKWWD